MNAPLMLNTETTKINIGGSMNLECILGRHLETVSLSEYLNYLHAA